MKNKHTYRPYLKLLLFIILCIPATGILSAKSANDSILKVLDREIDERFSYYAKKENLIIAYKEQLRSTDNTTRQFELCNSLFEEYIPYQYDSAYSYARQAVQLAAEINDPRMQLKATLNLFHCYVAAGLFKEGLDMIYTTDIRHATPALKKEYFQLCSRYYSNLTIYNNSEEFKDEYARKITQYGDSAKHYMQPGTAEYAQMEAFIFRISSATPAEKIEVYEKLLRDYKFSDREYATIHILLSIEYYRNNDRDKAIYYTASSALYDIRSAIRQTTSKTYLGQYLFEEGNVMFASKCIQSSLKDANFYNARHRKLEINSVLPIIESEKVNIIQHQKDQLTTYLLLLSLAILALAVSLFVIYRQIKKLKKARRSIEEQYNEISLINTKLAESYYDLENTYKQLEESNEIKDVYIVQSLYGKSEHIDRFENLIKKVERKVSTRQYDDLKMLYRDYNIKSERENMFSSFDKTFLILFPNFIEEFNNLFPPEDHVSLDADGNLPPEARIFALIRLGINDNERISKFLNISVKTLYSYKYKIKAKSTVPNEEFENSVMKIKKRKSV